MNALVALEKGERRKEEPQRETRTQKVMRDDHGHVTRRRASPLALPDFPLPSYISNDISWGPKEFGLILSVVKPVLPVLNYLYSGSRSSVSTRMSPTTASYCSVTSIVERAINLPPRINIARNVQFLDRKSDTIDIHLSGSCDVFLQSVVFQTPWNGLPERMAWKSEHSCCSFRLLDWHKLDLTNDGYNSSAFWISRLLASVQPLFLPANPTGLHVMLLRSLDSSSAGSPGHFSKSRLHCISGHYGKILELADAAGMIEWSSLSLEEGEYTSVADKLNMTSFAVRMDEARDRIISWSRTQNDLMLDPSRTYRTLVF